MAPRFQIRAQHLDPRTVLSWRQGAAVVSAVDVPRRGRFDGLGAALAREWQGAGEHRAPTDPLRDRAVLHTRNDEPYDDIVAAMDAVESVTRPAANPGKGTTTLVPAFRIVLSTN